MEKIVLFDTAEASDNLGDQIIMDYCEQQLNNIFTTLHFTYKIPTHIEVGKSARKLNQQAKYSIVCGTNIIKTSILVHRLWKISLLDALQYKNVCLMGCGWGNYNKFSTDPYTKWVYRRLFNNGMQHAVRDEYTQRKLAELGITNVIYTACPTMWNLTPEHCKKIPTAKAQSVMTTLTAYHADKDRDKQMMNILVSSYNQIFFWPQQIEDIDYLRSLDFDKSKLTILSPSLKEYDKILASENIDCVGTRLHGGIRALNFGRRTLIISIDNRATEINKTSNIPILNRTDMDNLKGIIDTNFSTNIFLPHENITKWKQQFRK